MTRMAQSTYFCLDVLSIMMEHRAFLTSCHFAVVRCRPGALVEHILLVQLGTLNFASSSCHVYQPSYLQCILDLQAFVGHVGGGQKKALVNRSQTNEI